MEQLKTIKESLVACVQGQLGDLKKVNAKEMGEVIDMIKDLEEAMYYCAITEAMEKTAEEKQNTSVVIMYVPDTDIIEDINLNDYYTEVDSLWN